ncbi:MAG: SCP2 sterol-binding domain-containing protein [Myxococcaceae bacterium]
MSWMDTLEKIRKQDFSEASKSEREATARDVINLCSSAATLVALSPIPIPLSDVALTIPIQSAMVITIGHIYGRKVTKADAKDLLVELGMTAGLGMLARSGIKALLPVVGALLTLPMAFAANWAIGRVAMEYFKAGGGLSADELKTIFEKAKKEGASIFSKEKFDAFRKREESTDDGGGKKKKKKKKKKKHREEREEDEASGGDERPSAPAVEVQQSKVAKLVERDFAEMVRDHADVAKEIGGVVHLDISGDGGGQWTVDFKKQQIDRGLHGSPKMTVSCAGDDLIALVRREKNPQMAVLTGALKIEPMDLELAQSVGKLFG